MCVCVCVCTQWVVRKTGELLKFNWKLTKYSHKSDYDMTNKNSRNAMANPIILMEVTISKGDPSHQERTFIMHTHMHVHTHT